LFLGGRPNYRTPPSRSRRRKGSKLSLPLFPESVLVIFHLGRVWVTTIAVFIRSDYS
jgi:hypothetical protein